MWNHPAVGDPHLTHNDGTRLTKGCKTALSYLQVLPQAALFRIGHGFASFLDRTCLKRRRQAHSKIAGLPDLANEHSRQLLLDDMRREYLIATTQRDSQINFIKLDFV